MVDDSIVDVATPCCRPVVNIDSKLFMMVTENSCNISKCPRQFASSSTPAFTASAPVPSPSTGVSTPSSGPLLARNLKLATSELERGCPSVGWSVGVLIMRLSARRVVGRRPNYLISPSATKGGAHTAHEGPHFSPRRARCGCHTAVDPVAPRQI